MSVRGGGPEEGQRTVSGFEQAFGDVERGADAAIDQEVTDVFRAECAAEGEEVFEFRCAAERAI